MKNRTVGELTEMARSARDALEQLAVSGRDIARSVRQAAEALRALERLAGAGEAIARAINNHRNGYTRGQLAVLVPLVIGIITTAIGILLQALK